MRTQASAAAVMILKIFIRVRRCRREIDNARELWPSTQFDLAAEISTVTSMRG